mmetsp:Transcript_28137/g.56699  ORF Transcript_28137/g.56699 Transcript_28137/m.56699 type:complete len:215 (-) Transcript_28137:32-676(-)
METRALLCLYHVIVPRWAAAASPPGAADVSSTSTSPTLEVVDLRACPCDEVLVGLRLRLLVRFPDRWSTNTVLGFSNARSSSSEPLSSLSLGLSVSRGASTSAVCIIIARSTATSCAFLVSSLALRSFSASNRTASCFFRAAASRRCLRCSGLEGREQPPPFAGSPSSFAFMLMYKPTRMRMVPWLVNQFLEMLEHGTLRCSTSPNLSTASTAR